MMNYETAVLKRLAQSFYTFFRTGVFRSEQIDISKLTLEQAYECQHSVSYTHLPLPTICSV